MTVELGLLKQPSRRARPALLSGLLLAVTPLLLAAPAWAQPVTFTFTGSVSYASGSPFGVAAPVGTPVSGTVTWDPNLPPVYTTSTLAGYSQSAPSGMTVDILGTSLASGGSASFQVQNNNFGSDGLSGFASQVVANAQPVSGSISFLLSDSTATALDSLALPAELDATAFSFRSGTLSGAGEA